MKEYEQKAKDFLEKTNTTFKAEFVKHGKHFIDDKDTRDIYKVTFTRGERSFFVMFGQSINDSGFKLCFQGGREFNHPCVERINKTGNRDEKVFKKECLSAIQSLSGLSIIQPKLPGAYDVLTCLQKYDVGSFKDFCDEFGYDDDSIKAHKTYKLVCEEYKNVCMLWNEQELELLRGVE